MHNSPEYTAWAGMLQRCRNPKNAAYPDYGGRGITVCDAWRDSFEAFYADLGPRPSARHSIDRIDNDGNYEPGNCRWATAKEQNRNTRRARLLTFDGRTQLLSDWGAELGVHPEAIRGRLRRGWSIEDALQGVRP